MSMGFVSTVKRGQHFDLVTLAIRKLKSANLALKGKSEREFEQAVIGYLQSSPTLRKNLITQVGTDEVEKITQANLFGFSHRPDASIGNDGTAIEIKAISGDQSARDILGQSIAYRMQYRFVIIVLVDETEDRRIVELCKDKNSKEYSLFTGLAETMNIFSIIGPDGPSKNVSFGP
ncbi:MAG: hypothetical protein QHH26_13510 [Armatimonadota bacterium]|nr:hypothetical protein [Armatimonadota bacterium]